MYMLNEVAINWNAPLVYALSLFVPGGAAPPVIIDGGAGDARDAGSDSVYTGPVAERIPRGCFCVVGETSGSRPIGAVAFAAIACVAMARRRRR
jgi:MYXO-CTERM domain-containing protein